MARKAAKPLVRGPSSKTANAGRAGARKAPRTARRRGASRGGSARVAALLREQTVPPDALALLTLDHREAEALFEQFEATEDAAMQEQLAHKICLALTVHTTLEEERFYPPARDALDAEDGALLDEATVEHASAKTLIAEIMAMTPRDALFGATVKVLGEYVKHHIREEETALFPKLRKTELDLYDLGATLATGKVELLFAHREEFGATPAPRRTGARAKSRR